MRSPVIFYARSKQKKNQGQLLAYFFRLLVLVIFVSLIFSMKQSAFRLMQRKSTYSEPAAGTADNNNDRPNFSPINN